MCNSHALEVREFRNRPHREAAVDHAIMHKHVGDPKEGDSEAEAKADSASHAGRKEPEGAQSNGRHGISDGVNVVGLKGSCPGLVVRLVQRPAWLELVPQDPVGVSRVHFHAELQTGEKEDPSVQSKNILIANVRKCYGACCSTNLMMFEVQLEE